MDYALDGTNLLQMIFIGLFRLAQHYQHLQARLLVKGDQVRFSYHVLFQSLKLYALYKLRANDSCQNGACEYR